MTLAKPNNKTRSGSNNLNEELSTNSNNSTGGKQTKGQIDMYDNYHVEDSLLDSIHTKKK